MIDNSSGIERALREMNDLDLLTRWHQQDFSVDAREFAFREIQKRNLSTEKASWESSVATWKRTVSIWKDAKHKDRIGRFLYAIAAVSILAIANPSPYPYPGYRAGAILCFIVFTLAGRFIPEIIVSRVGNYWMRFCISVLGGFALWILILYFAAKLEL